MVGIFFIPLRGIRNKYTISTNNSTLHVVGVDMFPITSISFYENAVAIQTNQSFVASHLGATCLADITFTLK